MNGKKNILLWVGAPVGGVLLVLALVFLGLEVSKYNKAKRVLETSENRLHAFYKSNPFPSDENVEQLRINTRVATKAFNALNSDLRVDQVDPPKALDRSGFMNQFAATKTRLVDEASLVDAKLPDDFWFGFDRYREKLPKDAKDAPRLAMQLRMIDALCRMLYQSRIKELRTVRREEFEADPTGGGDRSRFGPASRGGGADPEDRSLEDVGLIGPGELFGRMHFVLEFTASEGSLLDILNQMAACRMFTVVTRLAMVNQKAALEPVVRVSSASSTRSAGADNVVERRRRRRDEDTKSKDLRSVPHDDRVLLGDELIDVKMEVDVYRFGEGFDGAR